MTIAWKACWPLSSQSSFFPSFHTLPKGPALDKQKIRVNAYGQNLNGDGKQKTDCLCVWSSIAMGGTVVPTD